MKVGALTALKVREGSISYYTLTSSSSAWIGTRVWMTHKLKCVYDQNKLIRADVETRSSKGNYSSWVAWKNDHYEYDVRSFSFHRTGRLNSPVDFSIAKLYFEEPIGRKLIFAENHAEIVKLVQQGGHCFQVWTNQQKPSVFYYQNGKPVKIDMVSSNFSYTLELKDK